MVPVDIEVYVLILRDDVLEPVSINIRHSQLKEHESSGED